MVMTPTMQRLDGKQAQLFLVAVFLPRHNNVIHSHNNSFRCLCEYRTHFCLAVKLFYEDSGRLTSIQNILQFFHHEDEASVL
jgi:hypothetical protein